MILIISSILSTIICLFLKLYLLSSICIVLTIVFIIRFLNKASFSVVLYFLKQNNNSMLLSEFEKQFPLWKKTIQKMIKQGKIAVIDNTIILLEEESIFKKSKKKNEYTN